MRWLPIALLMAVSPVVAAYSGTFLDDFSDGNLDGWEIRQVAPHLLENLRGSKVDIWCWTQRMEKMTGLTSNSSLCP